MTPAATALVRLTPNSMQMENRKLPRKDSRNSRRAVCRLMGISSAGFQPAQRGRTAYAKTQPGEQEGGQGGDQGLDSAT